MKRKLLISGATSGMLVAGLVFGFLGMPHSVAQADTTGAAPLATIAVVGHSDQQITPDMVVIDAGITTNGHDAESAETANDAVMTKLMAALSAAGIATSDIRTTWYNIHINYGPPDKNGQPTMNGFQAANNIQVTVHHLQDAGKIVDLLVKSGANQINDVQYQISNPTQIEEKGYDAALADAKAQATNIANALGLNITGVQSVDTTDNGSPTPMFGQASAMSTNSSTFSPGLQDIMTNVRVVYTVGSSASSQ